LIDKNSFKGEKWKGFSKGHGKEKRGHRPIEKREKITVKRGGESEPPSRDVDGLWGGLNTPTK